MKKIQSTNLLLLLTLILIPNSIVRRNSDDGDTPRLLITNYKIVSAINDNYNVNNARGSHFDAASRLTLVMNGLVDALIDKVSFLAEIVIESSQEEECQASCNADNNNNNEKTNLPATAKVALDEKKLSTDRENKFDKNDFGNLKFFLYSLKETNLNDDSNANKSSDVIDTQPNQECSLFNIKINSKDLPVKEMNSCCSDKRVCYNSCGSDKKQCDSRFQACLKQLCKDRFDYTNKTLIKRYKTAIKIKRQKDGLMLKNNKRNNEEIPFAEPTSNLPDIYSNTELEALELIDLNESNYYENNKRKKLKTNTNDKADGHDDDDDDDEEEEEEDDDDDNDKLDADDDVKKKSNSDDYTKGLKRTTKNRLKDKYKSCKLASKVLIIGNLAFGCQAYKQAQWSYCCKHNNNSISNGTI